MSGTAAAARAETSEVARHLARVAVRLFAERGYDATGVQAIAEAAGVTKPTLYYHFGSKEGLAQAVLVVPLDRLLTRLQELLAGAESDPVGALAAMAEAHFAFCREDADRARFVYALFFGPLASGLADVLGRFGEAGTRLMSEAVGRLAAAGLVASDRVGACTAAVRGLIVIHTMDYLYRGADLGPDLARRLVEDLLRGFGAPGAGGRTDPGDGRAGA